ncbi:hypothetical protein MLPF_1834 [Mycobacterium lepromatosis]|nr:hypothetical protein MLPF_1834 [Mycobacterium lepromatosis]
MIPSIPHPLRVQKASSEPKTMQEFTQYALQEIVRQVVNFEKVEPTVGPDTAGCLHVFLSTSRILMHTVVEGTTNAP